MSFQAYLDNIEIITGKTPTELIALIKKNGFTKDSKAGEIAAWLKKDVGLGHGHAMALIHVFKKGAEIGDKHVDSKGVHRDESKTLRLSGTKKKIKN